MSRKARKGEQDKKEGGDIFQRGKKNSRPGSQVRMRDDWEDQKGRLDNIVREKLMKNNGPKP